VYLYIFETIPNELIFINRESNTFMKSFDIPSVYKSDFISQLKEKRRLKDKLKKDFSPTILDFKHVQLIIARHFGFCYGVENAVEIAYKALGENPNKRVFLLSEMIHNPIVNQDLLDRGMKFLMDTAGNKIIPFGSLTPADVVIVPAFGTTVELQAELKAQGIDPYTYDTTCPFVEKVWNRSTQISERGYSVIIHGKPSHEETRATFSHSKEAGFSLIINDMAEAILLSQYIKKEKEKNQFYVDFAGRYSVGFDPELHLVRFGVVNQTTMLASETQAIANYLKDVLVDYYKLNEVQIPNHFASTRDTLCYATNDNQDATHALLQHDADFAIVIGGYNSSNTSHLVELLEPKLPTFFISNHTNINETGSISHFDLHLKAEKISDLPNIENSKIKIIVTCGASCPDATVEITIRQILNIYEHEYDLERALEMV
jgi:4-hydroxy-3-methylbut-2-en-1-yl diphosphate reductase